MTPYLYVLSSCINMPVFVIPCVFQLIKSVKFSPRCCLGGNIDPVIVLHGDRIYKTRMSSSMYKRWDFFPPWCKSLSFILTEAATVPLPDQP